MAVNATTNKVLEKLRMFGGSWKDANPSGGTGDWPDNGSHVVILSGVALKESQVSVAKGSKFPGITVSLKCQLAEDPDRQEPRKWTDTMRFLDDATMSKLPEKNQEQMGYDRDRLAGWVKVITGDLPTSMEASIAALLAAIEPGPIVMRVNISSNAEGKYKRGFAQEKLPSAPAVVETPATPTPAAS